MALSPKAAPLEMTATVSLLRMMSNSPSATTKKWVPFALPWRVTSAPSGKSNTSMPRTRAMMLASSSCLKKYREQSVVLMSSSFFLPLLLTWLKMSGGSTGPSVRLSRWISVASRFVMTSLKLARPPSSLGQAVGSRVLTGRSVTRWSSSSPSESSSSSSFMLTRLTQAVGILARTGRRTGSSSSSLVFLRSASDCSPSAKLTPREILPPRPELSLLPVGIPSMSNTLSRARNMTFFGDESADAFSSTSASSSSSSESSTFVGNAVGTRLLPVAFPPAGLASSSSPESESGLACLGAKAVDWRPRVGRSGAAASASPSSSTSSAPFWKRAPWLAPPICGGKAVGTRLRRPPSSPPTGAPALADSMATTLSRWRN
mmetsp:Transcript_92175/g.260617  ORF Transcript_92175/g.260617 Transcript_92175/m.260617 type:complete len:374 (-) Transcript_92175:396-1517(-)